MSKVEAASRERQARAKAIVTRTLALWRGCPDGEIAEAIIADLAEVGLWVLQQPMPEPPEEGAGR